MQRKAYAEYVTIMMDGCGETSVQKTIQNKIRGKGEADKGKPMMIIMKTTTKVDMQKTN